MFTMYVQGIDGVNTGYPARQSQTGYLLCEVCRSKMRPLRCSILFYMFLVGQHPKIIIHPNLFINLLMLWLVVNVPDIEFAQMDANASWIIIAPDKHNTLYLYPCMSPWWPHSIPRGLVVEFITPVTPQLFQCFVS
jgi:hypothetical protein